MRTVLEFIEKTEFKGNPSKAQMVNQHVRYISLNLGPERGSPDVHKVKLISKLLAPIDVSTS